jgi:hypothetical protein
MYTRPPPASSLTPRSSAPQNGRSSGPIRRGTHGRTALWRFVAMTYRRAVVLLLLSLSAACAGGGASSVPTAPPVATPPFPVGQMTDQALVVGGVTRQFRVHVPAGTTTPKAVVRYPPPGAGLRHPDRAGAAGAPGRQHDDAVHPRAESGRAWGTEPARPRHPERSALPLAPPRRGWRLDGDLRCPSQWRSGEHLGCKML